MASHGGGRGMLQTILIWFAAAIAVLLILLWLATGGVGKIINAAHGIMNPFSFIFGGNGATTSPNADGGITFRLPWQPAEITHGPDIPPPDNSQASDATGNAQTPQQELTSAQIQLDSLNAQIQDAKTFGTPSPYKGMVQIAGSDGADNTLAQEYVEINASYDNTSPVDITGWSLQSALTGVRAYIPRGANGFLMGAVNAQGDMYLNAGARAVIASGQSPVGTSFRENICTGYLSQLQRFVPALGSDCPLPSDSFPETPQNLSTYGDACFTFVQSLSSCTFPLSPPPDISPACRIFLADNLSYNGCVQNYQHKTGFLLGTWRVYVNAGGELWRNTHDIIRLLDAQGRTVDVVTY